MKMKDQRNLYKIEGNQKYEQRIANAYDDLLEAVADSRYAIEAVENAAKIVVDANADSYATGCWPLSGKPQKQYCRMVAMSEVIMAGNGLTMQVATGSSECLGAYQEFARGKAIGLIVDAMAETRTSRVKVIVR